MVTDLIHLLKTYYPKPAFIHSIFKRFMTFMVINNSTFGGSWWKNAFAFILILFTWNFSDAQGLVPDQWYLLDLYKDGYPGISLDKANKLLEGRKSKTVVVAVLDSGVDPDHEDLKANMWVNKGEIPNNQIDDDGNGYIDDIHGWNFIGGKKGNISADSYEVTRMYAKLKSKYESADRSSLSKKEKKEYDTFLNCKEQVDLKRETAQANLEAIFFSEKFVKDGIDMLAAQLGSKPMTLENIEKIDEGDSKSLSAGISIAKSIIQSDSTVNTYEQLKSLIYNEFDEAKKEFGKDLVYGYNPDLNQRDSLVGDDINDISQRYYGNNNVEGPDATHGTHVAGLIGAVRSNGKGIDGIASNVKIMSVRCVPDGDERDKDVANAIRYAVDNGASIINMSFGKGFSPNKEIIDEAIKYAESKDVLLVHAAGNSGTNNDLVKNYPNKYFNKKNIFSRSKAKNWLEVGASTPFDGKNIVANFSNYGKKDVDFFSPGVQIYSTTPGSEYQYLQGTSFASPIAAGVAALIRSNFPGLTAPQIRKILMSSVVEWREKVDVPNQKDELYLKDISVTGGLVNAEKAVQLALKTKPKKKGKGIDLDGSIDQEIKSKSSPKA